MMAEEKHNDDDDDDDDDDDCADRILLPPLRWLSNRIYRIEWLFRELSLREYLLERQEYSDRSLCSTAFRCSIWPFVWLIWLFVWVFCSSWRWCSTWNCCVVAWNCCVVAWITVIKHWIALVVLPSSHVLEFLNKLKEVVMPWSMAAPPTAFLGLSRAGRRFHPRWLEMETSTGPRQSQEPQVKPADTCPDFRFQALQERQSGWKKKATWVQRTKETINQWIKIDDRYLLFTMIDIAPSWSSACVAMTASSMNGQKWSVSQESLPSA
jgi:hypothetical protein